MLAASISVHLSHIFHPKKPKSRFPVIDGKFAEAKYVDLNSNDRIYFRYGTIFDSGVEIERVKNGRTAWIVFMERLGVGHSEYSHSVHLDLDDWEATGNFEVVSDGSYGRVCENRSINTGDLNSRSDYFREHHMKPGYPPDWSTVTDHLNAWLEIHLCTFSTINHTVGEQRNSTTMMRPYL